MLAVQIHVNCYACSCLTGILIDHVCCIIMCIWARHFKGANNFKERLREVSCIFNASTTSENANFRSNTYSLSLSFSAHIVYVWPHERGIKLQRVKIDDPTILNKFSAAIRRVFASSFGG